MYYDIMKKLYKFSLVLGLGVCLGGAAMAQEIIDLNTDVPEKNDVSIELGGIPDEIALFENGDKKDAPAPLITPGSVKKEEASKEVPVIDSLNAPKPTLADQAASAPALPPKPGTGPSLPPRTGTGPSLPPRPGSGPSLPPRTSDAAAATPAAAPAAGGLPEVKNNPLFPAQAGVSQSILDEVDDEVFSQMSDIEKQTALLTLELRREKIKTEIEAIKAQREKAIEEQKNMASERDLKKLEMEKEQERKIIEEQIKLRKMEFAFEKLRQENLLKEYKEQMLNEEQKWIKTNMEIYAQVAKAKEEREKWTGKYKERLSQLEQLSGTTLAQVQGFVDMQRREISDLQTQISILKARLEAQQRSNPFGEGGSAAQGGQSGAAQSAAAAAAAKPSIKLSDLYVIMEITGKGEDLLAKVMNREGSKFLAKVGTKLKSGDVVDEITPTYIRTDNDGEKDYLYFSAGGVLEEEPENKAVKRALAAMTASETKEGGAPQANPRGLITSSGVPGVTRDMMLR